MRVISLKFLKSVHVPALTESLKEYGNQVCIAYKENISSPVYVITNSEDVIDYLFEVNPNCTEISDVNSFMETEIKKHILTNPAGFESYFQKPVITMNIQSLVNNN